MKPHSVAKRPKYLDVREQIAETVEGLNSGDRIATVRELKERFKVSQATLDRALNDLSSQNLLTRKWGSGIYVGSKKKQKETFTVGVLVSDVTDRFCALLVKGIEQQFTREHYHTLLCNGYQTFKTELEIIHSIRKKVDGLIINPTTANIYNPEYVSYFHSLQKKQKHLFLLVDIHIPNIVAPFLGFDNYHAFSEAVRMISPWWKSYNILYLAGLESVPGLERLQGFRDALAKNGVPEKEVTVVPVDIDKLNIDIPWSDFPSGRPFLFFVASPLFLPKLINQLQQKSLSIPRNAVLVSIVEEDYLDYITVPVIGLVKPSLYMGKTAAGLLSEMMKGKQVSESTRLSLRLEIPDVYREILLPNGP